LNATQGSQVLRVKLHRREFLSVGQLKVSGIQGQTESQQTTQYAAAGLVNILRVSCIGH
jgi:hypothetical protein